ncbi:hypothetical protein P7C73_g2432, partial [Tremellales sp. Uapishka_1]
MSSIISSSPTPFSEEQLNRFRIVHNDKDLRPLLRRLHRLPVDDDDEKDMLRIELLKWRSGIERLIGSVRNLERQKAVYMKKAQETVQYTESVTNTLREEQGLLVQRQRERDQHIKCDEIAGKIRSRTRTRKELDDEIAALQTSVAAHRASHSIYLETISSRIATFSQITKLVEDVRSMKLPLEVAASLPHTSTSCEEPTLVTQEDKMQIDQPPSGNSTKLNSMALPFAPDSRPKPSSTQSTSIAHPLPTRPTASRTATATTAAVATKSAGGHFEEGELENEEEDGEVAEVKGAKRVASGSGDGKSGRSLRSRK